MKTSSFLILPFEKLLKESTYNTLIFVPTIFMYLHFQPFISIPGCGYGKSRLGSFPASWRQVNITPIPKGPPSSSVANYRPISITSVLSTGV